jgi:hypothetical protein
MPNLPISQLPVTVTADTTDVIAIVNNGITKQISRNNFLNNIPDFSGNTDSLGGSTMRTIYSRTNVITYNEGDNTDLFSGNTNFGSRTFDSTFFSNSSLYVDKIIHFRATGKWGNNDNTPIIEVTTLFGNDVLTTFTVPGSQTTGANDHPAEIYGEIVFSGGNAIACYSIGWCGANGDYKRYALSDASSPISVTGFTGGDFKLIIGSNTTNDFTSYLGYIQVWS